VNKNLLTSSTLLLVATVGLSGAANAQTFKVNKVSIGGDGGTDYITAEPGTGRVFVSRATHFMVIDGASGKVLGDIMDTPRNHGAALALKANHGLISRPWQPSRRFLSPWAVSMESCTTIPAIE
jgi:hypothetical protein